MHSLRREFSLNPAPAHRHQEVVIGEMFWVGIKGAVMSLGVAIVLALFGMMSAPVYLPLLLIVGFLVALPCGAMGLLSTALVKNINQFQTVYSFLIAPLYYLWGIFFPIPQMHSSVRWLAEMFPLIHGVRLAQSVFWNKDILYTFTVHGGILVLQSAILCTLGYYFIRKKLVT